MYIQGRCQKKFIKVSLYEWGRETRVWVWVWVCVCVYTHTHIYACMKLPLLYVEATNGSTFNDERI